MIFMVMHKVNEATESFRPDERIIAEMGRLMGEAREKGILVNGTGLKPSKERVRLRVAGGNVKRTDGPLKGDNELVAGFAMLKVRSMNEAVDWGTRFAEVLGDGEIEIGPAVEPWDLGLMEKPASAPLRVLALNKADAASEAGTPPSTEQSRKLHALVESMKDAGVYLGGDALLPSSRGARLRTSKGKHSWTDGPFAESKELVAGFAMVKMDSLAEAKAWADRYADILGDIELDVREVYPSAG